MRALIPAAFVLALLAAPAQAAGPLAWELFCHRVPSECVPAPTIKAVLDDQAMALIRQVNLTVNRRITSRGDGGLRGQGNHWEVATTAGDCEDYALAKRRALRLAGLPAGSLDMATTVTRRGEGHAVLIVRTDGGDLVLDNLTDAVLPHTRTGYKWLWTERDSRP